MRLTIGVYFVANPRTQIETLFSLGGSDLGTGYRAWVHGRFPLVRARTTSAATRPHASYRLAVPAAKHGGNAREPAEASRDNAREIPAREGRGYLLAWAHNALALVAWRAGDGPRAVDEVERAMASLAELDEGFAEGAATAVEQTASHLAANLLRARSLR